MFDTNVFVSALTLPTGQAGKALLAAAEGRFELAISKPIIDEVLDVLARKFDRKVEELARVAVFLSDLGEMVKSGRKMKVLSDEPGNRILECAKAARADVIVTGDRAMLALGDFEGTRIIPLRQLLEMLA